MLLFNYFHSAALHLNRHHIVGLPIVYDLSYSILRKIAALQMS